MMSCPVCGSCARGVQLQVFGGIGGAPRSKRAWLPVASPCRSSRSQATWPLQRVRTQASAAPRCPQSTHALRPKGGGPPPAHPCAAISAPLARRSWPARHATRTPCARAPAAGLFQERDKPASARKGGDAGDKDKGGNGTAWPAVGDLRVLQRSALELAVTASLSHPHIIQVRSSSSLGTLPAFSTAPLARSGSALEGLVSVPSSSLSRDRRPFDVTGHVPWGAVREPQVYSMYTNMVLVRQKPPKPGTSGVQLLELSDVARNGALSGGRGDEGIPCSALCIEFCDMVCLKAHSALLACPPRAGQQGGPLRHGYLCPALATVPQPLPADQPPLWRTDHTLVSHADASLPPPQGTLAHAIDQNRFLTVTPLGHRRAALKPILTTLLEVRPQHSADDDDVLQA
jgi:hypothetical protein